MRLLITGGSGFIGSNFINYLFSNPNNEPIYVINVDKLTYAAQGKNIQHLYHKSKNKKFIKNYKFIKADITDFSLIDDIIKKTNPEVIINFAAESHNSYAILNPTVFFKTNLLGTQTLLESARKNNIKRFHQISTVEIFGDIELNSEEKFTEESHYKPNTPYNASKAAADLAVKSYFKTFNIPITISNAGNNYGSYQFPEKLVPLFITNLLEDKKIPLYKNSQNKREWIHVKDHCRAIYLILKKGKIGETYNIGTGVEKSIEEIASLLLTYLNKPETLKEYVQDRPSHDKRYLLDSSKIMKELNWKPEIDFETGLKETIEWYKENKEWWIPLKKKLIVKEDKWK